MAKRLFYSCRSPSAAAAVSPTTTLLPTARHPPVVAAPSGGACCPRRAPRRRGPQTPAACGAGGCAVDYGADDLPPARGTPTYRWLRSSHWHVIEAASADASDGDGDDTPRLKIDARRRARHSRRRRRRRTVLHRSLAGPASWSTEDSGWFSSDDGGGGEPLGAAGEASSSAPHVAAAAATSTTTTESSSTGASRNSAGAARGEEAAAAAAALAGGFAVVKRSDDPRADFRRSMAEMVVGRGIYDADGLERLLRCFLALNDRRHRRDIVAAFGDVWEAVFFDPPSQSYSHGTAAVASTSSDAITLRAARLQPCLIPR